MYMYLLKIHLLIPFNLFVFYAVEFCKKLPQHNNTNSNAASLVENALLL